MIADPHLPAAAALLGAEASSAIAPTLGRNEILRSIGPTAAAYDPGHSIRVSYRIVIQQGSEIYERTVVAMTRVSGPPSRVTLSEAGGMPIGVWRSTEDPYLPGLAAATDEGFVRGLMEEAGISASRFVLEVLTYSARSRAVIKVTAPTGPKLVRSSSGRLTPVPPPALMYIKVRSPERVDLMRRAHQAFRDRVPVAGTMAHRQELGLLAIEPLPGQPLWDRLVAGEPVPAPEELVGLVDRFADVDLGAPSARLTSCQAAYHNAAMLSALVPEKAGEIARFLEALGEESPQPEITIHGDFHEVQLLIGPHGEVSGLLDLDDSGYGHRVDDLAMMLGRLWCFAQAERDPSGRVTDYGAALLDAFSENVDGAELRRRMTAVTLNHACGHFISQERDWPRLTRAAIDRALAFQALAALD